MLAEPVADTLLVGAWDDVDTREVDTVETDTEEDTDVAGTGAVGADEDDVPSRPLIDEVEAGG